MPDSSDKPAVDIRQNGQRCQWCHDCGVYRAWIMVDGEWREWWVHCDCPVGQATAA